jgi:ABC-type multidrug transport system ATPase subunit
MIAGLLPRDAKNTVGGHVTVNGVDSTDKDIVWSNVVAYVDQIDRLHGYLTVKETFDFAFQCRHGGTHRGPRTIENDPDVDKIIQELDANGYIVDLIMRVIGLKRVENTFVGSEKVRGVSGGERKRVTVGEMMCIGSQVQMFDEISTGLDASTTYDIVTLLGQVTRMKNNIKVVSLLQPPPETVALFDEIILLDQGKVRWPRRGCDESLYNAWVCAA